MTEEIEKAEVEATKETEETTEETTIKEEVKEPEETLEQKEARLARQLTQVRKKLGKDDEKPVEVSKTTVSKTGELDETVLDFLDLKGITEDEDIEVIQKVMRNTGQTVRQALKDEYVQAKLATLRKSREVKDATPSATRRSSTSTEDISALVRKFEETGKLPENHELAVKVTNALVGKNDTSKPRWQR